MDKQDTFLFEAGQRVGPAVANYPQTLADFGALQAAETDRAALAVGDTNLKHRFILSQ